jgi:hypothetical protein
MAWSDLGARRRQLGRRRLRHLAPVAGAVVGQVGAHLALEPEDRAVHHRGAGLERGVVDQVAGREVVGPVHHHVELLEDLDDVVGPQPHVVGDDVDVGVERHERLLGRVDLPLADAVDVVEDLPLQVGRVDHVHVDDADGAHARRRQVHGRR